MSNKINTYNEIFEQRIQKIVKQIKELRKHPKNKERIKECLKEAKALKKKITKSSKSNEMVIHKMDIDLSQPGIINVGDSMNVVSIGSTDNILTIRFTLNK
jgi:hypothetical protein